MKDLSKIQTPVLLAHMNTLELTATAFRSLAERAREDFMAGNVDRNKAEEVSDKCKKAIEEINPLTIKLEKEISNRMRKNLGLKNTPRAFDILLKDYTTHVKKVFEQKEAAEKQKTEVKQQLKNGSLNLDLPSSEKVVQLKPDDKNS